LCSLKWDREFVRTYAGAHVVSGEVGRCVGLGPCSPPGAMVSIHFTGRFPGGAEFESSAGKTPTSFTLGENR